MISDETKQVFSEPNGKLSFSRIGGFMLVTAIVCAFIYDTIANNQINVAALGIVSTLASALYATTKFTLVKK